jgi:hypothetical protein
MPDRDSFSLFRDVTNVTDVTSFTRAARAVTSGVFETLQDVTNTLRNFVFVTSCNVCFWADVTRQAVSKV